MALTGDVYRGPLYRALNPVYARMLLSGRVGGTLSAPTCAYTGADDPSKTITLSTSAIPALTGQFGFDIASVMGDNWNTDYTDNLFFWVSAEVTRIPSEEGVNANVKVVAN